MVRRVSIKIKVFLHKHLILSRERSLLILDQVIAVLESNRKTCMQTQGREYVLLSIV